MTPPLPPGFELDQRGPPPPEGFVLDNAPARFTDNPGQNFRVAREGMAPGASPTDAAFRGFFKGATLNWIDELKGLAAAGGLDPNSDDGAAALAAIIKGAYKKFNGDADADAAYRATTSNERAATQQIQEQQPGASVLGEIGGVVASTLPFGRMAAPTLGGRMLQGARIGATTGLVAGAGEGTDTATRLGGAVTGGAVGAGLGAVAPPVVEGVVRGVRAAGAPFTGVGNVIRGLRDPEAEAGRRVLTAIQRDAAAAPPGTIPGIAPSEFAASRAAGGPATIMDMGGETTRALARSAANTSPEGRAVLDRTINDRFETQSERLGSWLNSRFGASDTGATREAIEAAARRANRPAYAKAYGDGDFSIRTPTIERLMSSPDFVAAMKDAASRGKSRAVLDGFGGFNPGVTISDSGVVTFTKKGPGGVPTYPNLQFWDYTKRALDDAARKAERSGATEEASVLKQLAQTLRSELDNAVPTYAGARAGAAQFFGAENALGAGEKFMIGNVPIPDARRAFAKMSPPEQQLFTEGAVATLVRSIEKAGDRRDVVNKIFASRDARDRIELAMGPQRFREFEAALRVEGIMDFARRAVQGNSTTARQLTELGLAGGAYGIGTGFDVFSPNPTALMSAALVYGAAKGRGAIDQRVARRVAEMLTSNDPAVLQKGLQVISRQPRILDALRRFDMSIARVSTQQGVPMAPALQAPVPGRSEDNQ